MRPVALAVAIGGFALLGWGIAVGGSRLAADATVSIETDDVPDFDDLAPPAEPPAEALPAQAGQEIAEPASQPRTLEPFAANSEGEVLLREPPRAPLSELSLALPPKPKPPKGGRLFQPVAVESAVIEAKGYRVAIAGVASLPPEEMCVHEGRRWPCGMRARSALRQWLRGRAVTCDLPAEPTEKNIAVPCTVGAVDVGAWLAGNGWARAEPAGPYAAVGQAAETGGKGIFGPPPDLTGIPSAAPAGASGAATKPADQTAPSR